MSTRKYDLGVRVRFKPTLGERSRYYQYRGKAGTVTLRKNGSYWGNSYNIDVRLDSGEIIKDVGTSVIELYNAVTRDLSPNL